MDKFQEVKNDFLNRGTALFDQYEDDLEKRMYLTEIMMNFGKILESKETYNAAINILRNSSLEEKLSQEHIRKLNLKTTECKDL